MEQVGVRIESTMGKFQGVQVVSIDTNNCVPGGVQYGLVTSPEASPGPARPL